MHRLALLALVALCACAEDYTVTLVNETGEPLVPYVVVTDDGPPRREADPSGTVAPGASTPLDPAGFNVVYYAATPAFGLALQFGLDDDPPAVLARSMKHQVPPGAEAGDPTKAPMVLTTQAFTPQSTRFALVVTRTLEGLPVALEAR